MRAASSIITAGARQLQGSTRPASVPSFTSSPSRCGWIIVRSTIHQLPSGTRADRIEVTCERPAPGCGQARVHLITIMARAGTICHGPAPRRLAGQLGAGSSSRCCTRPPARASWSWCRRWAPRGIARGGADAQRRHGRAGGRGGSGQGARVRRPGAGTSQEMPVYRDLPRRAVHVEGAGTGCRPRGGRADRLDHGGRRHAAPGTSPMSYAVVTPPLRDKPYCHTAG